MGLEYFFATRRRGIGKLASEFESLDYPSTERKFNSYLADFRNVPLEKVRHISTNASNSFLYLRADWL